MEEIKEKLKSHKSGRKGHSKSNIFLEKGRNCYECYAAGRVL